MDIKTEKHPPYAHRGQWVTTWSAWDMDTYDGAPDIRCPIGNGRTEIEAINDLVEQIVDRLEVKIDDLIEANNIAIKGWIRATGTRVVEEETE
jgi:hypothetical protein